LQPGSPGGKGLNRFTGLWDLGGQGGGALLIKANGSISIARIFAQGASGAGLRGGDGSGGHVVIDGPRTVRVGRIFLEGGVNGGGGVLEFRNASKFLGTEDFTDQFGNPVREPAVFGGRDLDNSAGPSLGIVGLPQGVAFPASGAIYTSTLYRTAARPDSTAPIITINGAKIRVVAEGSVWVDPGASATDGAEGSVPVTTGGFVNTAIPGSYEITYTAADSKGNTSSTKRYISVMPSQPNARDPQSGLPELVAASLRPVNAIARTVDARYLPTFEFTTLGDQKYPSVTFLRRMRDSLPIGSYPDSDLDKAARMTSAGLSYSFRTSSSLSSSWSTSDSLSGYTFVRRNASRNGLNAPNGWEFVTYRHNTPLGSSPPLFYRVAIKADPLN
jgi:hypothetical protein